MFAELLLATSFQVGPFYEQRPDFVAVRPFYAREAETTDVLWPVFTKHRDWWRFCLFVHEQEQDDGGFQFDLMPLWFNGRTGGRSAGDGARTGGESYWGLFPIYGRHPHFALMYDLEFALWPLWTRYRMPRPDEDRWLETKSVLFPFVSWRDDGAWSVWPFYGVNFQRESVHRYALWPFVTWADYSADRDTAGAGSSWMVWPFYGRVRRAYERQDLFLPPFFSVATASTKKKNKLASFPESFRLRCPWPFFEYESTPTRERTSVWPLWERAVNREYATGNVSSSVTRFGWKLIELYDDETRVFPFWTSRDDGSYFRLWPFWESAAKDDVTVSRTLALVPVRWVPAIERGWSKFWTFYERETDPVCVHHSLFWGIIRWRTVR